MMNGVFARRRNEQGALRRPLLRLIAARRQGYSSCGIMSLGLWKYFVGE